MKPITLLALLLMAAAGHAGELTVEQAYQAIPHNRTVFEVSTSKLSEVQAAALKRMFELADQGIVLRVGGLRAISASNDTETRRVLAGYDGLMRELISLDVSTEIKPVKNLVIESISLHQQYFQNQFRAQSSAGKIDLAYGRNPQVRQASAKLQMAYGLLIRTFPNEPPNNRQAFYDYLCALDFL